jgi:hypothetical protein
MVFALQSGNFCLLVKFEVFAYSYIEFPMGNAYQMFFNALSLGLGI